MGSVERITLSPRLRRTLLLTEVRNTSLRVYSLPVVSGDVFLTSVRPSPRGYSMQHFTVSADIYSTQETARTMGAELDATVTKVDANSFRLEFTIPADSADHARAIFDDWCTQRATQH